MTIDLSGSFTCGPRPTPNTTTITFYRFVCPYCDGAGRWPGGETCLDCHGYGLTNEATGYAESELTPAPRPPAVMTRPCTDCAYRPGSPEQESGRAPGADRPFFCHHGLFRVGDSYVSPALTGDGMPLGAMVCAGWWALATGRPLPEREFRDPGGSNRHSDAPTAADTTNRDPRRRHLPLSNQLLGKPAPAASDPCLVREAAAEYLRGEAVVLAEDPDPEALAGTIGEIASDRGITDRGEIEDLTEAVRATLHGWATTATAKITVEFEE